MLSLVTATRPKKHSHRWGPVKESSTRFWKWASVRRSSSGTRHIRFTCVFGGRSRRQRFLNRFPTDHCVLPYRHNKGDRKSTRLNSSHQIISYAVFCLKKKK